MGPDFSERKLLRIGRALELAVEWQESRPPLVRELVDA